MVYVRESSKLKRPPPMYKPVGVYLTVVLNHGGKFVSSPKAKYVGGLTMKLDYVVAKEMTLESLRSSLKDWLLCDESVRIYALKNHKFKELVCDEEVREMCTTCFGLREVVFYILEGDMMERPKGVEGAKTVEEHSVYGSSFVSFAKSGEGSSRKQRVNECENDDDDDVVLSDLEDSDFSLGEESEDDDLFNDANVNKLNESSCEDSDEEADVVDIDRHDFEEGKDSDGEKQETQYPVFNPDVIFEPSFELGMYFSSRDEFKRAVQSHAIRTKRTLKFSKIAPTRVYAKCANPNCKWKIHIYKVQGEESYQIRTYKDKHSRNCDPVYHVRNLKSGWVRDRFMHKIVADRGRKTRVFRKDVIDELQVEVTKEQAYRAKRLALQKLEGDPDLQYSKLWDYSEELRRTNPALR